MASRYPGELRHYEGNESQCNAKQETREIFFNTTSGTLRYKQENGTLVHVAHYSPNIKFTPEGGLAIRLINNTGALTVKGQIVDASGTLGFKTADANDDMPLGVVYEVGIANGQYAWIVTQGLADILIDAGGCNVGDWLGTGATAGSANGDPTVPAASQHFQEIGHCLESRVGAGLCRGILHFN
jgi:hypothetical protein